jgi:hypothetical protein
VNPLFYTMKPESEYDSWLTVGMVNADATSALSSIGLSFDANTWSSTNGIDAKDGAVFWMNPIDAPTRTDTNGVQGKGSPPGDIPIAQLTVVTGTKVVAGANAQGHTSYWGTGHTNMPMNWRARGIRWHIGTGGLPAAGGGGSSDTHAAAGPPCSPMQEQNVRSCTASCLRCSKPQVMAALSRLVRSRDGIACTLSSGAAADEAMQHAVDHCKAATPAPPPATAGNGFFKCVGDTNNGNRLYLYGGGNVATEVTTVATSPTVELKGYTTYRAPNKHATTIIL